MQYEIMMSTNSSNTIQCCIYFCNLGSYMDRSGRETFDISFLSPFQYFFVFQPSNLYQFTSHTLSGLSYWVIFQNYLVFFVIYLKPPPLTCMISSHTPTFLTSSVRFQCCRVVQYCCVIIMVSSIFKGPQMFNSLITSAIFPVLFYSFFLVLVCVELYHALL